MEKSDKQTDVSHPENGVNPLQTLKSHFVYVIIALFYFINVITPIISFVIKYMSIKKKGYYVDVIDEIEYRSELKVYREAFFLAMSVIGILIMVKYFILNLASFSNTYTNKIAIAFGAKAFLLIIILLQTIWHLMDIRRNDWLEVLEKDIYLGQITKEEARKKLELDYIGLTIKNWLELNMKMAIDYENEYINELDKLTTKIQKILIGNETKPEKVANLEIVVEEMNNVIKRLQNNRIHIKSKFMSYIKYHSKPEEYEEIIRIITEIGKTTKISDIKTEKLKQLFTKH